uniref:Uncharacterized protein n=1 Tax=Lotharella oceanica TaxID=641309 RepID=A0A7S2TSW5_9EUKA
MDSKQQPQTTDSRNAAAGNVEPKVFNEPHLPDALRQAQAYAGTGGHIVSLPELLAARANADFGNEVWNNWFTTVSEEIVFKPASKGKPVVLFVHGGGVLTSDPERIERCYRSDGRGMTSDQGSFRGAARLTWREASDLLSGRLPDGTGFPVYPFEVFKKGIPELPRRYAVVMDFSLAKQSKSGYESYEVLKEDPIFICRAGGVEAAKAYLEKSQSRHKCTKMGQWHPFSRIDASVPQGRITFLAGNLGGVGSDGSGHLSGYDSDYGIGGDANIHNRGRFIAIARCLSSSLTSLRDLPFGSHVSAEAKMAEEMKTKGVRIEATEVFASSLAAALRQALWTTHSGFGNTKDQPERRFKGFVASLPELMHARVHCGGGFDNAVWQKRFTANTEQDIVKTPDGKRVVVTVHGGGILGSPERIEKAFRMDMQSMTGCYAAKLTEREALDLLGGKLPDGTQIPVFTYDMLLKNTKEAPLPQRCAIVLDYDIAKKSPRGHVRLAYLRKDPNFIALAGGLQAANAYLNKVSKRQSTLGNFPPFTQYDYNVAQESRVLFLDANGSVLGSNGIVNMGRYVAVAPANAAGAIRKASFA